MFVVQCVINTRLRILITNFLFMLKLTKNTSLFILRIHLHYCSSTLKYICMILTSIYTSYIHFQNLKNHLPMWRFLAKPTCSGAISFKIRFISAVASTIPIGVFANGVWIQIAIGALISTVCIPALTKNIRYVRLHVNVGRTVGISRSLHLLARHFSPHNWFS